MAGCTMSKEERIAIQVSAQIVQSMGFSFQNVVGGRQPKLIQLQAEETDEEVEDEGEVTLDFRIVICSEMSC